MGQFIHAVGHPRGYQQGVSQVLSIDKQVEILHDHYKETFARIRDLERTRDRNFLWVIVIFALLAMQVGYPTEFGGSIQSLSLVGGELNLAALPLAALLSATWAMALAVALRYCQAAVAVDRQYPYLHYLEEEISPLVGGGERYQREGYIYLKAYPMLLNVAWIAYVIVFPTLAAIATVSFIVWEWIELPYPRAHQMFDTTVALGILSCFFLLRVQPKITLAFEEWRLGRKQHKAVKPSA